MLRDARQMSTPRLSQLLDSAFAKRKSLLSPNNDLVRLIDGEGDDFPGIYLETLGGHWLISSQGPSLSQELKVELLHRAPRSLYWKRLDQHQKESPVHLGGEEAPEYFEGLENGLKMRLSFQSGYSQGIFLDQRDNRAALRELMAPGKTLLNTFAYTGLFSIVAAAAGATTSTLDLSQVYLDWSRENFRLNEMDPAEHYYCKGDTFHWLRRFARQGRRFDAIVLDPPTFSRDNRGKIFRVEKDYPSLFELALACLTPGGSILACHNYRGMTAKEFEDQLRELAPSESQIRSTKMPQDFIESPYLKSVWLTI
jgi:23S rRNA (cytosine1962-C5)-methyltransferase